MPGSTILPRVALTLMEDARNAGLGVSLESAYAPGGGTCYTLMITNTGRDVTVVFAPPGRTRGQSRFASAEYHGRMWTAKKGWHRGTKRLMSLTDVRVKIGLAELDDEDA